jgi:hypothetical protein
MRIDGTGSGFTPDNVRNTVPTSPAHEPAPFPAGELRPRGSPSSTPPRRNPLTLPASLSAAISTPLNEVTGLLDAGGMAMLQQGAKDGFESLPPQYRSLALQAARLLGVISVPVPAGPAMPFPMLASRLEAVASASSHLGDLARLDITTALRHEPEQRAAMLAPYLAQLRNAGHITAAAIAQMPVAELRANKALVKEKLAAWAGATEALHEQVKAQFGETHPLTAAALEARAEASTAYGKSMLRLAVANLGNMAFNMTVGPVVAGVARLLGSGN